MSGNSAIPFEKKKLYRGLTREQIDALGPLTFGFDIAIASVMWRRIRRLVKEVARFVKTTNPEIK